MKKPGDEQENPELGSRDDTRESCIQNRVEKSGAKRETEKSDQHHLFATPMVTSPAPSGTPKEDGERRNRDDRSDLELTHIHLAPKRRENRKQHGETHADNYE